MSQAHHYPRPLVCDTDCRVSSLIHIIHLRLRVEINFVVGLNQHLGHDVFDMTRFIGIDVIYLSNGEIGNRF